MAVEPDERMAAYLVESLGPANRGLSVFSQGFEEVEVTDASFDLVTSATAFHWLNQPVALAKVGRILRRGGWLANWWNSFGDHIGVDQFHEATKHFMIPLGRPTANAERPNLHFSLDADARLADLRATGAFELVDHEIFPWPARFTPTQVRALYSTFPNVSGLPEPRRTEILDALESVAVNVFGGLVERIFYTAIYLARRA